MSAELTSIIATLVNVALTVLKLTAGILTGSVALMAESIHSGLDIISSLVTFIGIKTAQKPSDEKHPYGFYRVEVISGGVVAFLLGVSAIWIMYEGIVSFSGHETPTYSYLAIGLMVLSVLANEVMARIKFKVGNEKESISLVADGEHSRADVISSLGVLLALLLIPYITWIDGAVAIFVGIYILYEASIIGKEVVDSLIDVSDPEVKAQIEKIAKEKNIKVAEVKTRKIGPAVFAEMVIDLNPKLSVNEATKITKDLENSLDRKINALKQIVIQVDSHDAGSSTILSSFGGKYSLHHGLETIGPEKKGEREIVAIDENKKIITGFGAKYYLLIDRDKNGREVLRKEIKNPYFGDGGGHGIKFLKSVSADKFISKQIGPGARTNLENAGIKYEIKDTF